MNRKSVGKVMEIGRVDVSQEWDRNFRVLVRGQTIVLVEDEKLRIRVLRRLLKHGNGIKLFLAKIFTCLVVCLREFRSRVRIELEGEI